MGWVTLSNKKITWSNMWSFWIMKLKVSNVNFHWQFNFWRPLENETSLGLHMNRATFVPQHLSCHQKQYQVSIPVFTFFWKIFSIEREQMNPDLYLCSSRVSRRTKALITMKAELIILLWALQNVPRWITRVESVFIRVQKDNNLQSLQPILKRR